MRTALIIMAELALSLLAGCAERSHADNGAFVDVASAAVDAVKIAPQPDPISVDDILPEKPVPHPSCKCASCKCEPACVGACSIEPPAQVKAAPQMRCSNGQCYPVRRGLFGWRR